MERLFTIILHLFLAGVLSAAPIELYVNQTGSDVAPGTQQSPVKTLAGAVKLIPLVIDESYIIHVSEGTHPSSGAAGGTLQLQREMHNGASVAIVGDSGMPVLDWSAGDKPLVLILDGNWEFTNVQLGSRLSGQTVGFRVFGPAKAKLTDVRIRTASFSRPGIHATQGGLVTLFGWIELNEDLHDEKPEGLTFSGIEADYYGVVKFGQREGAQLSIGDGSLSASYYGVIELGCSKARITSWHDQANTIAINNSGRVDFHSTPTEIAARDSRNTPIGLEHDGHVLAEGAPIKIVGYDNGNGIVLQKNSSFYCNDVTFDGSINTPLSCMSRSTLLVGVVGDLAGGEVRTGGLIIVEKCTGSITKPVTTATLGQVILPGGSGAAVHSGFVVR